MTDKKDTTKELIEFLDDTIDYLGLYSPDKDGMIHTGFTVNQITKLKQIREILGRQVQPERNEISQKERDEVGLGEKKYILQDVEQPKPDNDELVRRLDEFERKSKAGMTILDIHMFEEIRLKLLQQSKPTVTREET